MDSIEKKITELKNINITLESLIFDISKFKKCEEELFLANEKVNGLEEELFLANDKLNDLDEYTNLYSIQKQNEKYITLGFNDISTRNSEAIHDAITFFNKKCPYCENELFLTTIRKQFEIDHFFPISKGGQDYPWNILPVCQSCNRKKRDILPHKFLSIEALIRTSAYLTDIYNKYLEESYDSYVVKQKILELMKEEEAFIIRNINTPFITNLLYLLEQHQFISNNFIVNNHSQEDKLTDTTLHSNNPSQKEELTDATIHSEIDYYLKNIAKEAKDGAKILFKPTFDKFLEDKLSSRDKWELRKIKRNWLSHIEIYCAVSGHTMQSDKGVSIRQDGLVNKGVYILMNTADKEN